MNKTTMLHSKFPLSRTSKIPPIGDKQNFPYWGQAKLFLPIASALVIILLSFTASFAQEEITDSVSSSTSTFYEGNTGFDTSSINWNNSSYSDSVDIVTVVKINNPDPEEMIEVRYGTEAGSGNLVAMNLRIVKEGDQYSLVYGNLKFPIDGRGYATIVARTEKAYLQQHDRYFHLKLKNKSGNQVKHIAKKENH
jgi:hypothetical protein